jgi:hypothetical protein
MHSWLFHHVKLARKEAVMVCGLQHSEMVGTYWKIVSTILTYPL